MIAHLHLITRLVTFASASWILAVVVWSLATGAKDVETPLIAVWVLIAGIVAQLLLWLIRIVARRS